MITRPNNTFTVTCLSDLHGYQPNPPRGDLLIIAGDLTARNRLDEYDQFAKWVANLEFDKIIICPGNHDCAIQEEQVNWELPRNVELLIDEESVYKGLIIYATPWTLRFHGQNPRCAAYTCLTESQLEERYSHIPLDTDILITHSPPAHTNSTTLVNSEGGSTALLHETAKLPFLKLHVYGHVHEARGIALRANAESNHLSVNAAFVNRDYIPYNAPHTTLTIHP